MAFLTAELGCLIANGVGNVRDNPFPHLFAITQKEFLHLTSVDFLRWHHSESSSASVVRVGDGLLLDSPTIFRIACNLSRSRVSHFPESSRAKARRKTLPECDRRRVSKASEIFVKA